MITPLNLFRCALTAFILMFTAAMGYGFTRMDVWVRGDSIDKYPMLRTATEYITWGLGSFLTMAGWVGLFFLLAVLPSLLPFFKLLLTNVVLRWRNPQRVRWARTRPHVEVPEHAWGRMFSFTERRIRIKWWRLDYEIPVFDRAILPEVHEWCRDFLSAPPRIVPSQVQQEASGVRIFVIFANPNDALAFKMRWC